MPDYTVTLTTAQDAALDILLPRLNATLPEGAPPYTKASCVQARAGEVADSYVAQVTAEEAQLVADAYTTANAAAKASVKSSLGLAD